MVAGAIERSGQQLIEGYEFLRGLKHEKSMAQTR
jgi:hypothetical protein